MEEKSGLLVSLEDEQTLTAELRHEQKSKEAAITRLTIEVQTLTSGNKALAKSIDELREKLAVAESTSKADAAKWATERQSLKDDVTRSQQKALQAKTERDAANEAINQVRTEEEKFKQWAINKRSAYSTSSGNRLFSRAAAEELTPVRDQPRGQSSSSSRKGLGSDIPMSPRSGATLHRGAADKHADDTMTAMIAIAQNLLSGPSVTLSKTHLTPQEVAKWIAHQRKDLR